MRVGSRNRFLEQGSRFYDVWNTLGKYQEMLDHFQECVNYRPATYRWFGEYFGGNVQKGVNYGPRHRILFFGLMVDDILTPFNITETYAQAWGFPLVPIVARVQGLDSALAIDTRFNSLIGIGTDNLCEGVVIMPANGVYHWNHSIFMLKKKNPEFAERQKSKRPKIVDDEAMRLNMLFREYITLPRLQGIFSKYGEIQEPAQIGQFIRWMLEDALEDFLQDYGEEFGTMDKKQQKQVLNVGGLIADMLKGGYL